MVTQKYSVIVPVFNRPQEVDELLQSLSVQNFRNFEVIIVEDGSSSTCEHIVSKYNTLIPIEYHFKENSGPGTSRNYGAKLANGQVLIFFDSDCIIPPNYFEIVENELQQKPADAFGGPDRAHSSFTPIQKAINYSMTSFFTTGGIRGGKERLDKFYPRSFNMGITKLAFEATGGFSQMRFGEDVDYSLRIIEAGLSCRLFPNAFVYHKRRTDFKKFYRQVFNSGIARINLHILHPGSLKVVHLLPTAFIWGMICSTIISIFFFPALLAPVGYSVIVLVDSMIKNKSLKVAILSIPAAWVQLSGYGLGFSAAFWKRIVMRREMFKAYEKNFYR
jgi:glycosyltransferase involved in cell wall biosynthesis